MSPFAEPLDSTITPAAPRRAPVLARAAVLLGGVIVLLVGMVISLGGVLLAPIGMWIAAVVQRRRGRVLTRGASWVVAAGSAAIALACFAVFVVAETPAGTWHRVKAASDSASAISAKTPPPAWLQRIAPNAARQAALQRPPSPAVESAMMIWGGGFTVMVLAAFYGSLGWVAGMLLGFGASGRWPGGATGDAGVLRL